MVLVVIKVLFASRTSPEKASGYRLYEVSQNGENTPKIPGFDECGKVHLYRFAKPSTKMESSFENFYSVLDLKAKQGIVIDIDPPAGYYDFSVLVYPTLKCIHTVPYLTQAKLRVPEDLLPGKYMFIMRVLGDTPESWTTRDSLTIQPVSVPRLSRKTNVSSSSDEKYYEALGGAYQSYAKAYDEKGYTFKESKISRQVPNIPGSLTTRCEEIVLQLKPSERAVCIFPCRSKTINKSVVEYVEFNGKNANISHKDPFNIFEISGDVVPNVVIRQYLFSCAQEHDILPFYVYVFNT